MICKKCGAQLEDNSKFCGICGATVDNDINVTPDIFGAEQKVEVVQEAPQTNIQPEMIQPTPVQPEMPQVNIEPVQPVPPLEPIDMNNGVIPPVETPTYNYEEKEKKHSALPIILIILIILILLGVGGFFAYKYFFNKPDKVVKGLINEAYDKFETPFKKYESKDSVLINSELSINTNIEGLEDLNGMKFNITSGIDYNNNKFEANIAYLEDNNKILEALMYVLDKDAYIVLKDIYSYPIKMSDESISFEEITSQTTATPEDIEFIMKRFKEIFLESLDMNDFKQSSTTITLNGSETKVKKISYTLDNVKKMKLVNNCISNIEKDEELMNKLSDFLGLDIETLKIQFDNSKIESIDDLEDETIKFDIYTKGVTDEFVGMDIDFEENTTIKVRKNNDNKIISINMSGATIELTVKEESKEKTTIDVKINVLTEEITGKIVVESKEIDSKTTETKTTLDIKYQEQEIGFTLNMKQQIGANISDVDLSNAKEAEDLTQAEIDLIEKKIEEKISDSKLYRLINSSMENMLNGIEQSYYDDLYYDDL